MWGQLYVVPILWPNYRVPNWSKHDPIVFSISRGYFTRKQSLATILKNRLSQAGSLRARGKGKIQQINVHECVPDTAM